MGRSCGRGENGQFVSPGNNKYRDAEWLKDVYVNKRWPIKKISAHCRCEPSTIFDYIKKFGFPYRQNTLIENGMWGKRGPENPGWKGGKTVHSGYIMIKSPNHPARNSNGYVAEHRLEMEKFLGRYLSEGEKVHHLNGIKTDNRIENLSICSQSFHMAKHGELFSKYEKLKSDYQKLLFLLCSVVLGAKNQTKGELRLG